MAAAKLDLSMEQGATFSRVLTFKDDADVTIDLTGRTFAGKIRKTIGGQVVGTFTFTLANQITNEGQVTMLMTAANTDLLPAPKQSTTTRELLEFVYDVEMTHVDTVTVDRVLEGKLTLSPSVTK